jgi:hypothetical protein
VRIGSGNIDAVRRAMMWHHLGTVLVCIAIAAGVLLLVWGLYGYD